MPIELFTEALLLDGQSARGKPVRLELIGSDLHITVLALNTESALEKTRLDASQWKLEAAFPDGFFRIHILGSESSFCEGRSEEFLAALSASRHMAGDRVGKKMGDAAKLKGRSSFVIRVSLWMLALGIAAAILYSFVLPHAATLVTKHISRSADAAIGRKAMESLPWEPVAVPENARPLFKASQAFLDSLGARRGLKFRLHWMGDPSIANALALPGGDVLLFPGILSLMDSSSELLAVLAHEAGHEAKRHGMRRVVRAGLIGIISALSLGDVSGFASVMADNAGTVLALSYNRAEEAEADAFAVEALSEMAQNCHGLELFLGRMRPGKQPQWAKFLSTHPADADRVAAVRKLKKTFPGCEIPGSPWIRKEDWLAAKTKTLEKPLP